jgi:1,4-dihydroxy-2-naphthoate octaprenyltransferase
MRIALTIRALRLPFTTASVLPYVFGALLPRAPFRPVDFLLGLVAVVGTHLAANLANDLADTESGVDAQDPTHYGFFGGSKLMVEGVLSRGWYRRAAFACGGSALAAMLLVSLRQGRPELSGIYLLVLLFAAAYSLGPLRLSYRRFGEAAVFVLFGPLPVLAGATLRTGAMPGPETLLLSLPFGFLTAAILVANEVPDCASDLAGGKVTLVGAVGVRRGYLLFAGLVAAAYAGIVLAWAAGGLDWPALLAFAALPLAMRVTEILRREAGRKAACLPASRGVILLHLCVGLILILERAA